MKITKKLFYLLFISITFLVSCAKEEKSFTTAPEIIPDNTPTVTGNNAILDLSNEQQVIDGFGGSTAWNGALSDAKADVLFGNNINSQMGLTICRLRIDPNNNWNDEKSNAIKANARGAKVFASPWSAPVSLKSNNSVVQGRIDYSKYNDYALYLKSFGDFIKAAGVTLTAISIQNEPDWKPDYESCSWTGDEIAKFTKENAPTVGYPFMIGESLGLNTAITDPALNDAVACANVSYVGGHLYGKTPFTYTNAISKGKKIWMTEHYYDNANNNITEALKVAKEINDCMCSNMNAYVWWWMLPLNGSTCNLIDNNNAATKNGCAIAQYAKWVRPGFKRIIISPNPYMNVYLSAYKNGTKTVIVIVNSNTISVKQPVMIQNGSITSFTPYETSSTNNIATLSVIAVTNGNFSINLNAQSITTLVSN
jgi:glucuronoarabinoxylan endo-1,4-beta-xylanase